MTSTAQAGCHTQLGQARGVACDVRLQWLDHKGDPRRVPSLVGSGYEAIRDGEINLKGPPELVRGFPRWLKLSPFAQVLLPAGAAAR